MSENNNNNVCDVCGSGNGRCGRCGNMCGWNGTHLLRWILGIIIITWVFCLGMRFGQMTAGFGGGYGYGNHMYFRSMPMMGGATWGATDYTVSTQAVPMMQAGTVKVIKSN